MLICHCYNLQCCQQHWTPTINTVMFTRTSEAQQPHLGHTAWKEPMIPALMIYWFVSVWWWFHLWGRKWTRTYSWGWGCFWLTPIWTLNRGTDFNEPNARQEARSALNTVISSSKRTTRVSSHSPPLGHPSLTPSSSHLQTTRAEGRGWPLLG